MTNMSLVSNFYHQDLFPVNANPWQTGLWLVPVGAVNSDFITSQYIFSVWRRKGMVAFTTINKGIEQFTFTFCF